MIVWGGGGGGSPESFCWHAVTDVSTNCAIVVVVFHKQYLIHHLL